MGEIDDVYKGKVEDLDDKFLQDLKAGNSREKVIKSYLKKFSSLKNNFKGDYSKSLKKEKKRIWSKKETKVKKGKFKRLKVGHFTFKPTFFEKLKRSFELNWFYFKRAFHLRLIRHIPEKMIYIYFKITKGFRRIVENTEDFYDMEKTKIKEAVIKDSILIWVKIKKTYSWIKNNLIKMFNKIGLFKVKKKEGKEGDDTLDMDADPSKPVDGKDPLKN